MGIPFVDASPHNLGDMDPEAFRKYGYQVIDWIADYLSRPEDYPVLSQVAPGQIRSQLPQSPPEKPESMDKILADLETTIVPGITHWNHPAFFAYFSISASAPGILGELLCSAFNVNAMLWKTSPSATELEEVVLDWLRQMLGLPDTFDGIINDTASVSSLCAIAAAREVVEGFNVREEGLAGRSDVLRIRLYVSEQAHSSIEKAAIVLGIGQAGIRKIPTDAEYRMNATALEQSIKEDLNAGWRPLCVVATVGTTSSTSIDPVPQIAEICKKYDLWLHVDAAYGGAAAIVPEMKYVLDGCEQADSIVINPHKWLFTPIDASAFYCRRPDVLKQAFSLVPEYLETSEEATVKNYMDYGIQLGRRFRALKMWMVFRYFGQEGIVYRIREHIRLARMFAEWIDSDPNFERVAPVPFSVICFRAMPANLRDTVGNAGVEEYLDDLNEKLLDSVNNTGRVFLSHTRLNGRFVIRLAIGNIRTTEQHIAEAWKILKECAGKLVKEKK